MDARAKAIDGAKQEAKCRRCSFVQVMSDKADVKKKGLMSSVPLHPSSPFNTGNWWD